MNHAVLALAAAGFLLLSSGCSAEKPLAGGSHPPVTISSWVVSWDRDRGIKEYEETAGLWDGISLFAADFDEKGNLHFPKELENLHPKGQIPLYLTIVNDRILSGGKTVEKDREIVAEKLKTEESRYRHVKDIIALAKEKQVDGIILNASGKNSSLITKMSGQVPFALFSRKIPDPQFRGDFVDNDNYSGLRELTAQLLRLGHRKIGFINGQSYVSSAAERFSGFQSAMRDAGIDVGTDYPYLYSGNFNRLNSGKEGARVLWEKGVTAILCGNNLLALGALQYCKEAGLRLPEDLSLCSFGTLANQDLLFVRPTSCEQNPDAMGARLAELIIERIESKNQIPNREIRFTTTILPGNGVGGPREQ